MMLQAIEGKKEEKKKAVQNSHRSLILWREERGSHWVAGMGGGNDYLSNHLDSCQSLGVSMTLVVSLFSKKINK